MSYWTFDDGTGTTATDSIGGKNGTLVNFSGSPWTTGKIGSALTFGGANDYVQVLNPNAPLGNSARTIAGWANFSSTTGSLAMVSYGERIDGRLDSLALVDSSFLRFSGNGAAYDFKPSITAPSAGQWHFYAITYDSTTVKLYMDGSSLGTMAVTLNTTNNTTSGLLFGTCVATIGSTAYVDNFPGTLDEWGLWNRALSSAEISELYNGGAGMSAVPEPSTYAALAGIATLGLAAYRRWSKHTV